jgi:Ni,Fe-hydrogenase III component G
MHRADFKEIRKEEIVDVSRRMKEKGCPIVVIAGYVDKEERPVIAYSYDVDGNIETYSCIGESTLPSITPIYGAASQWFEEEITELMQVEFDGLEKKGRLFLPEEFDGSGQIIVTPMSELRKDK